MNRFPALGFDFVARRRSGPLGWGLLAAGVVLVGLVAFHWQAVRTEAARGSAQAEHWQKLARRLDGGPQAAGDDSAALRPQIVAAAKAIDRLATPWGALYRSLESSVDDSVSLLAIAPNADKGEVRLNGEAKDFAALRAYLKRLGESEALTDVRLLGQEIKQSDAQHPIAFSLVATWRKAS